MVTVPQTHKPTNKHTHKQTHRQDRLQYTAPLSSERSVMKHQYRGWSTRTNRVGCGQFTRDNGTATVSAVRHRCTTHHIIRFRLGVAATATATTTFGFCLPGPFSEFPLQVRPVRPNISERRTFEEFLEAFKPFCS